MGIDPVLKEAIRLGEIRVGSIYGGSIQSVEQLLQEEFKQLGLRFHFFDWENLPQEIANGFSQDPYGPKELYKRQPEAMFSPNSINIFYNCRLPHPSIKQTLDRTTLKKADNLAEFISYFEGGSGRITEEEAKRYKENKIYILLLFPTREDWANHVRGWHTGREFSITSDSLLIDNDSIHS